MLTENIEEMAEDTNSMAGITDDDREVVLAAVKQSGGALEFYSKGGGVSS